MRESGLTRSRAWRRARAARSWPRRRSCTTASGRRIRRRGRARGNRDAVRGSPAYRPSAVSSRRLNKIAYAADRTVRCDLLHGARATVSRRAGRRERRRVGSARAREGRAFRAARTRRRIRTGGRVRDGEAGYGIGPILVRNLELAPENGARLLGVTGAGLGDAYA